MTLDELKETCERTLAEPYAVRAHHLRVAGRGWQWRVTIEIDDGGIVATEAPAIGAAVRQAHKDLAAWVARFGF